MEIHVTKTKATPAKDDGERLWNARGHWFRKASPCRALPGCLGGRACMSAGRFRYQSAVRTLGTAERRRSSVHQTTPELTTRGAMSSAARNMSRRAAVQPGRAARPAAVRPVVAEQGRSEVSETPHRRLCESLLGSAADSGRYSHCWRSASGPVCCVFAVHLEGGRRSAAAAAAACHQPTLRGCRPRPRPRRRPQMWVKSAPIHELLAAAAAAPCYERLIMTL